MAGWGGGGGGRGGNTASLLPSNPVQLPIPHSKELSILLDDFRQTLVTELELYKFKHRNIFLVSLRKYILSAYLVQAPY